MVRLLTLLTVLCALCAGPTFSANAAPLTPAQAAAASKLLNSDSPKERAAAYKGFRDRGEEVRPAYLKALEKARAVQQDRLKSRIRTTLPLLQKFSTDHATWVSTRDVCLDLLYKPTDHNAAKLAELARAWSAAEEAAADLDRHFKRPPDGLTKWETAAAALNEISGEQAWCRGAQESDREYFHELPASERAEEQEGGRDFLALAKPYQAMLDARAAQAAVTTFNEREIHWPSPALKTFMQIINHRRAVLGLVTLRLDERLSACAKGHSEEMQQLKYFAHESPVEENKTPWDRAKNAKFEGNCMGENIFMGSPAPESAFHGWWESDGHRFIMFQKDANTLGLGVVGIYWTLNTGKRDWPASPAPTASKKKG